MRDFIQVIKSIINLLKPKPELSDLEYESIIESTMFLKIFYLCNFANYMGNKNPFVIEIEFYIKQLPRKFLLKPMNM